MLALGVLSARSVASRARRSVAKSTVAAAAAVDGRRGEAAAERGRTPLSRSTDTDSPGLWRGEGAAAAAVAGRDEATLAVDGRRRGEAAATVAGRRRGEAAIEPISAENGRGVGSRGEIGTDDDVGGTAVHPSYVSSQKSGFVHCGEAEATSTG